MSEFHFGYAKNNYTCSCGKHYGVGDRTPEQRAASIARMRDVMPSFMTESMKAFLADFERWHGVVRYSMGQIGVNTGSVVKESKNQPLNGPIYDSSWDMAKRKAA